MNKSTRQPSAFRLRLGLTIWLLTWIPFSILALPFLRHYGHLQDVRAAAGFVGVVAATQYAIGMVAVVIMGREVITLVKQGGWRSLPARLWRLLRNGHI